MEASSGQPIRVESIVVKPDRVACRIAVGDERYRYSDARVAAGLVSLFPSLAQHACVNGVGQTLGSVIRNTSVPHLLEHVWIELQVRSSASPDALFVGTTEWLDEDAGIACVQVSYRDDLQALRTFNEATQILNNAVLR